MNRNGGVSQIIAIFADGRVSVQNESGLQSVVSSAEEGFVLPVAVWQNFQKGSEALAPDDKIYFVDLIFPNGTAQLSGHGVKLFKNLKDCAWMSNLWHDSVYSKFVPEMFLRDPEGKIFKISKVFSDGHFVDKVGVTHNAKATQYVPYVQELEHSNGNLRIK